MPVANSLLCYRLGPLIEVPVLLVLSYVALYLRDKMSWEPAEPLGLRDAESVAEKGSLQR